MTATIGAIAPVITTGGGPLQTSVLDKLRQMRIQRAANLMGRATLRFSDAGFELSATDTFSLGKAVVISEPGAGTLFRGTVTGVDLEQMASSVPELVVVADDDAYKLTRGNHVVTYLNGTYVEALRVLASRAGISINVQQGGLPMDYLLQAGSDLDFLNAVADRLGYAWYIDDTGTLVVEPLTRGRSVATLSLGTTLLEFAVRASGLRPTAVSVYGWSPDQQANVTDSSSGTSSGETPSFLSKYTAGAPASELRSAPTAVTEPRPLTAAEAKELANARYDDWSSAAIVARGSLSVNSAIKPGVTVTVTNAGPASGDYLVTEVEHIYDGSGFSTKFVSGSRHPARLVDTLGPEGSDPGFTMAGLVVGVVTDNNDPDSAGRVKVRYTGVSGDVESPWARVVTLGGGAARGAVFNPEITDEVLVGFEHGDTRRPVVIGGLFSNQNALPTGSAYVAEGKVNYRRIASRKNHIVEFADGVEPAQQHVLLPLGTAAHKLRLGADRFDIEVEQGKGLTIKAGSAKFDISAAGDVTIEGNNVTIKANAAVTVEGNTQATIKSNTQTVVQSTAEVQVKGTATTSVESSGLLTLKGTMVAIN
jgi:phage baseplate assembly protein gpV